MELAIQLSIAEQEQIQLGRNSKNSPTKTFPTRRVEFEFKRNNFPPAEKINLAREKILAHREIDLESDFELSDKAISFTLRGDIAEMEKLVPFLSGILNPQSQSVPERGLVKPCLKFRNGSCLHGSNCHFSHVAEAKQNLSESKAEQGTCLAKPCVKFRNGSCSYGSKCHFSHNVDAVEIQKPLPSQLPSTSSERRPCTNFQNGSCSFGFKCHFSHDVEAVEIQRPFPSQLPSALNERRPCTNFQNGSCSYGANCRYSHNEVRVVRQQSPLRQPRPAK